MLKSMTGLGVLVLLLSLPLQAEHRRHRWERYRGYRQAPGYVEVYVGTPHGYGVFTRGFRPNGYYDDDYYEEGRGYRKFKYNKRHYYKRHRHHHYDGYCPY